MLWPAELVEREKRSIRRTALVGGLLPLVPAVVVALLHGRPPVTIPYYHVAIGIAIVCLVPGLYLVMPFFDGALMLGRQRLTGPRAALLVRCTVTNLVSALAFYVFLHSGDWRWFAAVWALSLPAAAGILRRIGAYVKVLERTASGEART
jgi:hypothetical protein